MASTKKSILNLASRYEESNTGLYIEQPALDKFNELLSDLGSYDACYTCFLLLSGVCCAWNLIINIFLARDVEFNCIDRTMDECDRNCPEKVYDPRDHGTNIVVEWNLVCDKDHQGEVTQSILFIGNMVGCLWFGHLADQYGRRPNFLFSSFVMVLMSLLAGITPWYWLYCFARFFIGFGVGGMLTCCLVFLVEYVDFEKREMLIVIYRLPYAVGYASLPAFAYFIDRWRPLQLMIAGVGLVFVANYWLFPESPRWLLLVGYIDKCTTVLHKSSKNRGYTYQQLQEIIRQAHFELRHGKFAKGATMADLFRSRNMLKSTCILCFSWFTLFFIFFGVLDDIVHIHKINVQEGLYVTVGIAGCVSIIGTLIAYPIVKHFTRRVVLWVIYSMDALLLFVVPFVPNEKPDLLRSVILVLIIGISATGFVTVQILSTELFPTVLRNTALGLTSCVGRIGCIIAPFIYDIRTRVYWAPSILFGVTSLIAAIAITFLPETKAATMHDTIEESENFGASQISTRKTFALT